MPAIDPTNPQQNAQQSPTTPQPPEEKPDWVDPLMGGIERIAQNVEGWSREVVKAVQGAPAPAQPSPTAQPPVDDDALQAIAAKGWEALDARADERAQKLIDQRLRESLGPWLQQEVPERASANETAARTAVDAEFGAGTFDEVFKPELDKHFGDRVLDRAAIAQYRVAVDALKGQKFGELADRRAKAAEAKETQQVNTPFLPGPGFINVPDNELSEDDQAKLKAMRARRLATPTDEQAAKLRDLMIDRGPDGVSFDDFAEAFPLPKTPAA